MAMTLRYHPVISVITSDDARQCDSNMSGHLHCLIQQNTLTLSCFLTTHIFMKKKHKKT